MKDMSRKYIADEWAQRTGQIIRKGKTDTFTSLVVVDILTPLLTSLTLPEASETYHIHTQSLLWFSELKTHLIFIGRHIILFVLVLVVLSCLLIKHRE